MIGRGKRIYLCRPDRTVVCQLNGIRSSDVDYSVHVKDYNQLSFKVDEYIIVNGEKVKSNGYDLLDVYLNLYLEDEGYFQMQHPEVANDGKQEYKTIVAYSLEKEWEQHNWVGLKVNTADPDSLEMLAENNINDLGFAKEYVTFYRPDKQDLSLVHLMLKKMKGWSVSDEDIDPVLWHKKIRIEENNISLYALATSVIAPKLECLFLFDTVNKKIKAIDKTRLDRYTYDTNIFIGFRNLANHVNIDVDEDSVYTRFNCQGNDELSIADVNFGDSHIVDYSYFMREPYMGTDNLVLIDESDNYLTDEHSTVLGIHETLVWKVQQWIDWRNANRQSFIDLSKQRAEINADIYDIKYSLPNDGTYWKQWDDMTEDLLNENLQYYNALVTSLQISVDPSPQYDSSGKYIPWKNSSGKVDHDRYLSELYKLGNGYGGYYTYYETITYIIPNIEIAIENLGKVEKKDYIVAYETDWTLYGIEELTAKKSDYTNQLETLSAYSKPWSSMTKEEKAVYANDENMYNANGRTRYIEISGYLGSEKTKGTLLYQLKLLNDKLEEYENELKEVDDTRSELISKADISNPVWGMTENDLEVINTLTKDIDYTNSNIITTSIDTTLTTIDREEELYQDSVNKLSEVARPQYSFSVSLDNLLNIPEFSMWKKDFELLNFFRLGVRDDYSVKLRMIGYSYNPCDVTSDLSIQFSSMITSKSGRSDLTDLLNTENNSGSRNSISIGTGNSNTEREYVTALLQQMMNTSLFRTNVASIAGSTSLPANIDPTVLQGLVDGYLSLASIDVDQITGNTADFIRLHSEYIDADVVVGNSGTFATLDTDFANLMNAVVGKSSTETGIVFNLNAGNASIDSAFISSLVAGRISVGDLATHTATADQIVLISSKDGTPTIAFKDSTQQFYDSKGNVRVQIGQDGTGDFNFIVVGADGSTALFDSKGITQSGIPKDTIVNNMIVDSTIEKSKLGFTILEPNEQGGIDITNVYDGEGGKFGESYASFVQNTNGSIQEINKQLADLSGEVEAVELTGSQIFIQDNGGTITPSSITVTATCYNGFVVNKWYINGVVNTSYVSADGKSITIPSSEIAGRATIVVKAEGADTSKFDVFTIYRISDGVDSYTVTISSNEGTVFKTDSGITSTKVTCTVYHGSETVTASAYDWYYADNDGEWKKLGLTGSTITLPLNASIIRKRLRCSVTV